VRKSGEVQRGPERLRVGPWRGDPRTAYVAPVSAMPPPTPAMVRHACAVLADRGYADVVTGALSVYEQRGFLDAGFSVREELHLLGAELRDLPPRPEAALRRGGRRFRAGALAVDAAAFDPFWRLDEAGLDDALKATPSTRFRVATDDGTVIGYAVCGRAGSRGYVQRLAVDPGRQGRGLGAALLIDGLRWLSRRGAKSAVVNTQVGNERALHLYTALGFRLQPTGLAVLARRLESTSGAVC